MISKTCPKCKTKVEDEFACKQCGINFEEYEFSKQEKLREIRILLGDGKFKEARQLAETLPARFPDNQSEFLLILSNINRDISIVEKCRLAQEEIDGGNFSQATFLLRNLKAFDDNLNEKVISLRRKAERHIQNDIHFSSGIAEFNMGNYPQALKLLKKIEGHKEQHIITEHLQKIHTIQKERLNQAVDSLKRNQLKKAADEFNTLLSDFPDMKDEIAGYTELLSQRDRLIDNILGAARKANKEKRYLESKILYLYLGRQFPETLHQVQPYINDIGSKAVVSMAEIEDTGPVDRMILDPDLTAAGKSGFLPESADDLNADADQNEPVEITVPQASQEGETDLLCAPVNIGGESVADFIY